MVTKLTALGVSITALLVAAVLVLVASGDTPAAPPTTTGDGEADATTTARTTRNDTDAKATLKDVDGNVVGVVRFDARRGGKVEVEAEVNNVSPADEFHGFHVHTTGKCDPNTDVPFSSAEGHFNPTNTIHGQHAGDFPVLLVKSGGRAEAKFETDRFKLSQLFDEDGSAVIIHADPDNYANIPAHYGGPDATTRMTGDAGARFACGIVRRT